MPQLRKSFKYLDECTFMTLQMSGDHMPPPRPPKKLWTAWVQEQPQGNSHTHDTHTHDKGNPMPTIYIIKLSYSLLSLL